MTSCCLQNMFVTLVTSEHFFFYSHFPLFILCRSITSHSFWERLRPISLRADSLGRVRGKVWRQSRHRGSKILAEIFLELARVSLLKGKRPIKKYKLLKNVCVKQNTNMPFLFFPFFRWYPCHKNRREYGGSLQIRRGDKKQDGTQSRHAFRSADSPQGRQGHYVMHWTLLWSQEMSRGHDDGGKMLFGVLYRPAVLWT